MAEDDRLTEGLRTLLGMQRGNATPAELSVVSQSIIIQALTLLLEATVRNAQATEAVYEELKLRRVGRPVGMDN